MIIPLVHNLPTFVFPKLSTAPYSRPLFSSFFSLATKMSSTFDSVSSSSVGRDSEQPPKKDKASRKKATEEQAPHPKYVLKTAKGTTDFGPCEMAVRNTMFRTIRREFELHGGVEIDTPIFEARDILTGKYGEECKKLIYDLEDQGGELCSLRYDLTVPFARYVAMNRLKNIKRFHIGKVYRRDQPTLSKGRRREFFQCDFDIAGVYDQMVPDAEVLSVLYRTLFALGVTRFAIKINHRAILLATIAAGMPETRKNNILFTAVSSAVDKLDKLPWDLVRHEMIEKGVSATGADLIGTLVCRKSVGIGLIEELLTSENEISIDTCAKAALEDMKKLFAFAEALGVPKDTLVFDLSLARGLDYYTGVIFEAVLLDEPTTAELRATAAAAATAAATKTTSTSTNNERVNTKCQNVVHPEADTDDLDDEGHLVGVGSIAAGGRYDGLVGMFMGPTRKGVEEVVPCVGVSIGVERIFSILLKRRTDYEKHVPTQVLVMSVGGALLEERMNVCCELRKAGISCEFLYKRRPKLQPQFDLCDRDKIPFTVILGPDELEQGIVKIKDMRTKTEGENSGGVPVSRDSMVDELLTRISSL